ncbi:SDR family NAD(P)-dependent oxidoreductase [Stenotrophobium rhamnosiphilum]|uniref:Oxidoreductase n=1 Tax=Stenotrophobium rhamnosiphilum TaxID=2029166 RepID=A0A2T5MC14_9GAMM|nr:SDR family oxidoreductase [Stenotrophobium rhamnosiphilum]PTU30114.1 oxidoreductase [Stenotrophobium rhamnosiphilum]
MAQELAGKVAIITGGASGIGRATVELFVKEGAKVVLADIDATQGEALAAQLGTSVRFKRCDVGDATQIQELVEFAISTFGGLHIMFNNAGISGAMHARFLDDDLKDFQKVIGINLYGSMIGAQCAARHMSKNGGGVIINNASIAGILAGQALITYRTSKAALIHFSKSIAIDLAEYGIRVICLAPGHIRTPLTSFAPPGTSPEVAERVKKAVGDVFDSNQPLKRQGSPEDVANAVLFIASDKAAQITGIVMPIDGGITTGDPVNHLNDIMAARTKALAQ